MRARNEGNLAICIFEFDEYNMPVETCGFSMTFPTNLAPTLPCSTHPAIVDLPSMPCVNDGTPTYSYPDTLSCHSQLDSEAYLWYVKYIIIAYF